MHPAGYGRFDMKTPNGWQGRPAHKVAFIFAGGETTAESPLVLQTCGNRLCCNPADLKAGNHREAQMARRAATARSEASPSTEA